MFSLYLCSATGTQKEREVVEFVYKFSTRNEYDIYKAEKEDVLFNLKVVDDVALGDSFDVKVVAQNKSNSERTVKVNITSVMAFYTGIPAKALKGKKDTLHLGAKEGTIVY